MSTSTLLLAFLPLALPLPPSSGGDESPPPSTVLIKGVRTPVGSKVEDVEDLFLQPQYRGAKDHLIAETPQHVVKVCLLYTSPSPRDPE